MKSMRARGPARQCWPSPDKHCADDRRREHHRAPDGASRVAALAGQDGDVLQTAQRAEQHLPEEREHAQVVRRRGQGERRVVNGLVVRMRDQRKQNERGEDDEDGDAADVVDPLAEFEASQRSQRDAAEHHDDNGERDEAVLREPRGRWPDQVRDFRRHGVEDRRHDGDAVDPEIPRREKAAEIAKGFARPDVQAAFERHGAVQADHRSRHGHIEGQHGGDPGERLRPPESAGDANPRSADDAQDLGEHEVAEAKGAVQLAAGLRTLRILLGHGSNMVARNSDQRLAFSESDPAPIRISERCTKGDQISSAVAARARPKLMWCSRRKGESDHRTSKGSRKGQTRR